MASDRAWSPSGFLVAVAALTALLLLGTCLLPQTRYVRFTNLHESAVAKAGWIYERIHFDPTPIDVAFIGTSHTVFGVDGARVEQAHFAATGQRLHVVNFAMPHFGRDLQYLLAREVLRTRTIKLLVIEVREDEPRSVHPAFGSLADPIDLVRAPIVVNTLYFDNLAHLPLRQFKLAIHSLAPKWFGVRGKFSPKAYAGSHWNDTFMERGARDAHARTESHTAAELEVERTHFDRMVAGKITLPGPLKSLETRVNLIYLGDIVRLATEKHVSVHFLYLPNYATKSMPRFQSLYTAWGSLWYPKPVLDNLERWLDVGHLNYAGAQALSDWLGNTLARDPLGSSSHSFPPTARQ